MPSDLCPACGARLPRELMPTHLVRAHPDRRPSFTAPEPALAPPTEAYEGDVEVPVEEEAEPLPTPPEVTVAVPVPTPPEPVPISAPPLPSLTAPMGGPATPAEEPVPSFPDPASPGPAGPTLPPPEAPSLQASLAPEEQLPAESTAAAPPPLPGDGGGSDWRVPSAHELRSAYGRLHHRTVRSCDQAALWAEGIRSPGRRAPPHR